MDSLGEQNEQMSIRMSELERAVHIERESLREEINLEISWQERKTPERKNGRAYGEELVANDKRGGTARVTLKRRHGEYKNSTRAVS